MSKHTPGPWEIRKDSTTIQTGYRHVCSNYPHGRALICEVIPLQSKVDHMGNTVKYGPWDEETAANAALISAAPDMAEALRRVDAKWNEETGRQLERIIGTVTCNLIRAALQKAGVSHV
jgi:hypothetical protein